LRISPTLLDGTTVRTTGRHEECSPSAPSECYFAADRAAPTVLLLRGEDRPKEKWEPWLSFLGCHETFAPGGLEDLLVEGCQA
jgi:hypothetical protein